MTAFAGPFAIAACLLAVAGVAKAVQPVSTAGALRTMRLPHQVWMVRVGGIAEALVAAVALATGHAVPVILVAASYLAFTAFVAAALRAGVPIASCGCLGKVDTPPHPAHIALNFLAAFAAVGFAAQGGASIGAVLADQPMWGLPFALLVVVGVGASSLVMSALPRTLAAAHGRTR